MPLWAYVADTVGAALLLVLLFGLCLFSRRRWISRDGGTFELSLRVRSDRAGRGWVLGIGRYSGDLLEFFRVFSLSPRPREVLHRADLTFAGQREAVGMELHSLYAGHVIIALSTPHGPRELALASDALTGLLAWLEAGPPGVSRRIL